MCIAAASVCLQGSALCRLMLSFPKGLVSLSLGKMGKATFFFKHDQVSPYTLAEEKLKV